MLLLFLIVTILTSSFQSISNAQSSSTQSTAKTNSTQAVDVNNSTKIVPVNISSTIAVTTTLAPSTVPTAPPKRPSVRAGARNCAANGSTSDVFTNCGYRVNVSPIFELKTCPEIKSLSKCDYEEFGYGNCMLCITSLPANNNSKDPKLGRIEFESGPIEDTGPQCQVRVRVASEGSREIGLWKIVVRKDKEPDRLVGSLLGSYLGETDIVSQLHSYKNVNIVVFAEQWSNFTGRKAIGSISFEFCKFYTVVNSDNEFTCSNGKKLSSALVCDFVDDCGDSSDEKPETAGCGHRTEHCMFPRGCQVSNGWSPIEGRIIPRLGSDKDVLDGFLPPTPRIAPGANLPSITDQTDHPNGLPLIIDLTSKLAQADDTFIFDLPEIDAVRDLNDHATQCWLRFYYYVPPGLQIDFSVMDSAQKSTTFLAQNLQAVASSGWIREQIELELFHHHLSNWTNDSSKNKRVEFYKPLIRIQIQDKDRLSPQKDVSVNGFVGFWGLSYSHGCRTIQAFCPSNLPDRPSIGCRRDELACSSKTPINPGQLVETMFSPKDGAKEFCYAPSKKCDFQCDCHDCSDEADCGSNCTFGFPQTCGWLTGDNWLWPPKDKTLCNGQSCIITVPDSVYRFFPEKGEFLKSRALLSNMYEWINPIGCVLTFQYRLWPGTGLSVVQLGPDGDIHFLWYDGLPLNSTAVTTWRSGSLNFTKHAPNLTFTKFRIAFLPESTAPSNVMVGDQVDDVEDAFREDPRLANYPVGLAQIVFSQQCGAPTPNGTSNCPPKAAVCQMGTSAADCVAEIESPIYACKQELISCNSDGEKIPVNGKSTNICSWKQPSLTDASQPEISSTEIFRFRISNKIEHCNRGSCFMVVRYDLHDNQSPSAYLAVVIEETDIVGTFNGGGRTYTRRQRIWQFAASDYKVAAPNKFDDFLARIPFNYCPNDIGNKTRRYVSIQFEGTSGDDNLKIEIKSVHLTKSCFPDSTVPPVVSNGYEITCPNGHVRCLSDKRCYPKSFICGRYAKRSFIGDMCPGDGEGKEHGFDTASSECTKVSPQEPDPNAENTPWSAAKIFGVVVGVLVSLILVVLASYALTIRVIRWYKSGGGHRHQRVSNSEQNGGGGGGVGAITSAFSRNDGHHFQQLVGVDNSTQMMLDMLVNDEENNNW